MEQRVILNLGKGDWQEGLPAVTLQLWEADHELPMQITGSLPPALELESLYRRWQRLYEALYVHRGWRQVRSPELPTPEDLFEIEDDDTYVTDVSETEFKQLCQHLEQTLNHWLNCETFRLIERQLRTRFTPTDEIRVIITAETRHLLRLPWHLWQFFTDYPQAELGLSLPDYTRSPKTPPTPPTQIRILAILGNSQGININHDRQLLEQLPDTDVQFLVEPALNQINLHLWQPSWDILFFAGHSSSQGIGKIQINATESLTLDQLKFGLKKAIANGLKLAIFNSCDGLELAWDLADLHIPQVIVMREPVPDRVAQEFLKSFLLAFHSGTPFYLAVREAREKLQALETDFPCATWLPVICQNPAELPMRWEGGRGKREDGRGKREDGRGKREDGRGKREDGRGRTEEGRETLGVERLPNSKIQTLKSKIAQVFFTSVLATASVFGVRSVGLLQSSELWAFDQLMRLRPIEAVDDRLLVITIDEAEIQGQNPQQRQGSLSDQTLEQLLRVLERAQPRVIGVDIYRDFPTSARYPKLRDQLRNNQRLVLICKSRDEMVDRTGIASPPEASEARVGFSDFLEDEDGVLRRQLLFHSPDPASPCTAPYGFNLRLAFRYLEKEQIKPTFTPDGNLQLGKTVFPRLQARTGGYQGIDAEGNQVMLNYRSRPTPQAIAPQVSLSQVLKGQVNPAEIRDRIVLIGVTASSSGDIWATPYGTGMRQIPGVLIQAHMTSQILSAVLDRRPLIWVWAGSGELGWIGLWALIGSFSGILLRLRHRVMASAIACGIATGLSVVLLGQGGWVPLLPAILAIGFTASTIGYLNRERKP
jgi:CHASE2 domain-containing sensor protein